MANFRPKQWTNPFGKKSIFRLSRLLVFIRKKAFSLENIIKHIFLAYIAEKNEDKKMADFGPKPWTIAFGKNSISRQSQHLVFFSLEGRSNAIEYHKTYFSGLHCLKKRRWKNGQFWTKTMD